MTDFTPVALFDMDGTLCDYVGAMNESLEKLRHPDEPRIDPFLVRDNPVYPYLWARMDLVKASEEWWATLPRLELGFQVLEMATELGYEHEILTQSPRHNPAALAGKLRWIRTHLGPDVDYSMTRNKSRHYGRVFVDDFPDYVEPWLRHRPNGLVIMPKNPYNEDFSHPQVIHYDGDNDDDVYAALERAREQ